MAFFSKTSYITLKSHKYTLVFSNYAKITKNLYCKRLQFIKFIQSNQRLYNIVSLAYLIKGFTALFLQPNISLHLFSTFPSIIKFFQTLLLTLFQNSSIKMANPHSVLSVASLLLLHHHIIDHCKWASALQIKNRKIEKS